MTTQEFPHQHTAHCESGVMSTLLKYHGHNLDEAMIFGIAHALTFVWMPLIKLNGMPLVSYRTAPRSIIKNTCKALGLKLSVRKFSDAQSGQAALDTALSSGKLAGLQTSVFWLPYFPPQMRFHFNAHNLLVYGKDGNDYLISDPVFETVQRCAAEDLQRARFAKGVLAAKGMMYTLEDNRPSEKIINVDADTLLANAELLARAMYSAVVAHNIPGIKAVLPIYEQWPEHDRAMARYAKGLLAQSEDAPPKPSAITAALSPSSPMPPPSAGSLRPPCLKQTKRSRSRPVRQTANRIPPACLARTPRNIPQGPARTRLMAIQRRLEHHARTKHQPSPRPTPSGQPPKR